MLNVFFLIKGKTKIPNCQSSPKVIEGGKSYNLSTIHDRAVSWLGTGTSMKSGGVKLDLWAHSNMIWSRKRV